MIIDGKLTSLVDLEVRLPFNAYYNLGIATVKKGQQYSFHKLETDVICIHTGYRQWIGLHKGEYYISKQH